MTSFRRIVSAASYLCHAFVVAPCLARPVACFVLGAWVVAVVTCPKVLTTFRVVALDLHVGIAEGHLHDIAVRLLHKHDELLLPVGGFALANTSRLVERRSDSIISFGVSTSSLPQVIFSLGGAPEYPP